MADAKRECEELAPGRSEVDALFDHAYAELRRVAQRIHGNEAHSTLSATGLLNEAWLKLASAPPQRATSELHLKRIAARAMRQVLVEAARRRGAEKRGGELAFVTLDGAAEAVPATASELLALDSALEELAQASPRQAALVECRFFGGMDASETAKLLGVSEATLLREWRAARAWLAAALRGGA
jgi:RNA polymerase sigma factor (TIGR02999 family)